MVSDITTIFTVWKRSSLEEQLIRIKNQSLSSNLIVWQNDSHVDVSDLRDRYGFTHIHSVNRNWKFYGRFSIPGSLMPIVAIKCPIGILYTSTKPANFNILFISANEYKRPFEL